ncbi:hypothetical protein COLO4_23109 [Corchorus olitorius]|uniref:Uncharacterized protein n=1 Tax=Corchorus olitorius TaxID=93759 RepID=A0A1R3IIC1_9ROSI|nr:hypothetical protein COLO4_23109 [Corchorus olitorius]
MASKTQRRGVTGVRRSKGLHWAEFRNVGSKNRNFRDSSEQEPKCVNGLLNGPRGCIGQSLRFKNGISKAAAKAKHPNALQLVASGRISQCWKQKLSLPLSPDPEGVGAGN